MENFHEFLRGYTDIFAKNVISTEDHTYKELKTLIHNKDVVILKGDKDSSIVIMNKADYINKMETMIEDGIENGTYAESGDTTMQDLKRFQDFLRRNFKKYEHYSEMYPESNERPKMYGTAKTHKFDKTDNMEITKLKFRPIIDQTGTYTYKAAKVISQYLKPLCDSEYTIKDTQSFANLIKELPPLKEDEEDVSYDIESLFTNIPINDTIDYILDQIYVQHKLKPICNKLIFKRLLIKLSTEVTFTFNSKFCKQTDGCTMGGPLSVTFSDIYMTKMERDVVRPFNPIFYRRYVDDIYNRRKINKKDDLYEALNKYHENIKLTVEKSPSKFLDTKLIINNGIYETQVYRKETKMPTHWSSNIPKRYKRNAISVDLHRSKRLSSNFDTEVQIIKSKFKSVGYPLPFIDNVIRTFKEKNIVDQNNATNDNDDEPLIPPYFFEVNKRFILLKLPFCQNNEIKSKHFLKKFHHFTKNNFDIAISWETRKIQTLFHLKEKKLYPACKIYYGVCECGEDYIGETKRNTITRWSEHDNATKDSEPSRHLSKNINHIFT